MIIEGDPEAQLKHCHFLNFPYSHLSAGHVLTVRNKKLWLQSILESQLWEENNADPLTPQPGSTPRGKMHYFDKSLCYNLLG